VNELEKYKSNFPQRIGPDLLRNIFKGDDQGGNLELIISIEQTKLNIKELSRYLELIYRIDGFLSELTLFEYSHRPQAQIEIDEIRFGSWELVIKELFNSSGAERLVLLGLSLRYLPKIMNGFMDVALKYIDYQDKREDYLEKKERRKFRKSIRDAISEDAELNSIDKQTKEKIVDFLDELYIKNSNHLPAASRFASKSVKETKLRKKSK